MSSVRLFYKCVITLVSLGPSQRTEEEMCFLSRKSSNFTKFYGIVFEWKTKASVESKK